jgi:hypothetical protein
MLHIKAAVAQEERRMIAQRAREDLIGTSADHPSNNTLAEPPPK